MRSSTALALAALTATAAAQDILRRQVVSTFIYTTYGDRTPMVLDQTPSLTPLGAQQMYAVGQNLRRHYVTAVSEATDDLYGTIRRMSPYQIPPSQITVLSRDEQYISAGASAFMQGLYPPLEDNSNYTFISGQSALANGSNVVAPLSGYQYPRLQTPSENDLNNVWLDGSANCPYYTKSGSSYYTSTVYEVMRNETAEFYLSLYPDILEGNFDASSLGYFDAWTVYDFLQYQYNHNSTVRELLSAEDLLRAKILATNWVMAMNANTSSSGVEEDDQVGVVAGKTLAARVLQAFSSTITSQGARDKMTLLFGSFEPIIAFTTLAGLNVEQHSAFQNIPPPGSSIVFELFSLQSSNVGTYPAFEDLYVRFLFSNGTTLLDPDAPISLVPYPLFSRSPSQTIMSLNDFTNSMQHLSIGSIAKWCETCDSYSIFCPAFDEALANGGSSGSSRRTSSGDHGISPGVAGVVGAAVALIVAGVIAALLFFLVGLRVHRVNRGRRSDLGGFKGAEKLASDQDLTLPKGGAGATVVQETGVEVGEDGKVVPVPAPSGGPGAPMRGHERVGSWELKEQQRAQAEALRGVGVAAPEQARMGARRPSYEDDDDMLNVNPYARGVKADERV